SYKGERARIPLQGELYEVNPIFAVEDRQTLRQVLSPAYHVVVGNPPYITAKDRATSTEHLKLYSTHHDKYDLSPPFTQLFFEIALSSEGTCGSGYVGLISDNAFMKRDFGKKLSQEFFPKIDLTHVIDTSGAYIPGHGTPTVILFG